MESPLALLERGTRLERGAGAPLAGMRPRTRVMSPRDFSRSLVHCRVAPSRVAGRHCSTASGHALTRGAGAPLAGMRPRTRVMSPRDFSRSLVHCRVAPSRVAGRHCSTASGRVKDRARQAFMQSSIRTLFAGCQWRAAGARSTRRPATARNATWHQSNKVDRGVGPREQQCAPDPLCGARSSPGSALRWRPGGV
jgi:hypothetical protein